MRNHRELAPIAAVALALLVAGCGASRMERMTMTAGALHSVASGAGRMIDRAAEVKAQAALDGCEVSAVECESLAAAEVESLRPAQAAQHLFAASVETFISAVITASQDDGPGWDDALRHLGDAIGLYEAMRDILAEFGITTPSLPAIVHEVMGAL